MKAFCSLAGCADAIGENLWNYKSTDGKSIKLALDFIVPYIVKDKPWTWPNTGTYDDEDDRLNSILFLSSL